MYATGFYNFLWFITILIIYVILIHKGVQKKKTKTASSAKKSTGSKIGGASGLKSLGAASSSITASRHRDRSNRGSSASSGDNKRKRKDRTG